MPLQLEVSINGTPTHLIGAFEVDRQNHIFATSKELASLGLSIPGASGPDQKIELDRVAGLSYRYDEPAQTIAFTVGDGLRQRKFYDARQVDEAGKPESGTGALVNYSAYGAMTQGLGSFKPAINGGSLSLDARAYAPAGTFSQSGIIGTTTFSSATALRLDSTWTHSNEADLRTFRAGDMTSGGLAWTRPVRLGGVQMQRDFALRPDLVTMPLPAFAGSAAVPSTVDVYINNIKAYSQQVDAGPFQISDLPAITGEGNARIVVTDPSGRQTTQDASFFTSPDLLRKGLYDYSLEAGFARRNYGTSSFDYDKRPAASASLRHGITDWITGELHGEAGMGIANAGAGVVTGLGRLGELTGAVAGSLGKQSHGALIFAGWDNDFGRLHISASTRRTLGNFGDLASQSLRDGKADADYGVTAKAVDQLTLSYGFPEQRASLGVSLIHLEDAGRKNTFIASASLSKTFTNDLSTFATGYADIGASKDYGAMAGFTYNFGPKYFASSTGAAANGSLSAVASMTRVMDGSPGSYGWQVSRSAGGNNFTQASGAFTGSKATVHADAFQQGDHGNGDIAVDGAVVMAGGGVFLGNRIDDAFAIVDAGAPNVPVSLENRPAGSTGADGKLLVPGLLSYEKNHLSLDVRKLPVTADVPMTQTIVVPRGGSGVNVNFGVKTDNAAAMVIVTDAGGKLLPVGATLTLENQQQPFVIGYDGTAYLTGLKSRNVFSSTANGLECSGEFSFHAASGRQQTIGPIACR